MKNIVLETKNLGFNYPDGTKALDNVSVQIERGKTTAILGGNGAGKSTLFLHLNGILKPSTGEVIYKGETVTYGKKTLNKIRQSIGIVFQDPDHQLFSASVYEDISFGAINLGLPEKEVRARVEKAMAQTGITELSQKPTHSLSYGQKKRVAMAGVIVMQPQILILDEPTAGLDPQGTSEMMRLIRSLQAESDLAVILSTHDIDLVPLYCDTVYVLNRGCVVEEGTPDEIFSNPESLRKVNLRLTRIGHLMEILKEKDDFQVEGIPATITKARAALKDYMMR